MPEDPELLRAKLNLETARIPWHALQRFFAQGRTLCVAPDASLVDVAVLVARDEAGEVRRLLDTGRMAPVSDQQARAWLDAGAEPWCVVVRPWVLVQPAD